MAERVQLMEAYSILVRRDLEIPGMNFPKYHHRWGWICIRLETV